MSPTHFAGPGEQKLEYLPFVTLPMGTGGPLLMTKVRYCDRDCYVCGVTRTMTTG